VVSDPLDRVDELQGITAERVIRDQRLLAALCDPVSQWPSLSPVTARRAEQH
jgi:hypothetical protein